MRWFALGISSSFFMHSPDTVTTPPAAQDQGGAQASHPGSSSMAQEGMVLASPEDGSGRPLDPPLTARPTLARPDPPPCITASKFDGLAAESLILRGRGLSRQVISTLIRARKPVSRVIYYRVWRAYVAWRESKKWHPRKYTIDSVKFSPARSG